jgi:hypothetical protein
VLGADAIKGEFSNRSASGPDGSTLAGIRSHALSAFQTPGRDHRFIAAPCMRLRNGAARECVLYGVYAVDADAVEHWVEKGYIAGTDAAFDDRHAILNPDQADVFTHLSDAERAVAARNDAALRIQREQLRRMACRGADAGGPHFEWSNEILADRYKDLETAPAPVRLTARSLTRRLLGAAVPPARPAP